MKKWYGVHALRMAVGITMLGLLLVGGVGAKTITVNASSDGDYRRIQDAIDNASAGDTILVYGGIYYENVNVTKQLNLRGIGNPVVDAGGSGSTNTLAADGITLEGFTATGSGGYYGSPVAGIKVTSSNNTLSGNNASNNHGGGISLSNSSNNTLTDNNVSNNGYNGISLSSSSNNTLNGNNASNNYNGISLSDSSNNMLFGNNASNNGNEDGYYGTGIFLDSSSKSVLINNIMKGNNYNFVLEGSSDPDFDNQIDTNNLVDGKPVYYIQGATDRVFDSSTNAGTFYCIRCVNVTLKNLNLKSDGNGIFFRNTTQSRIQNVNASNNYNTLTNNTASLNNRNDISYFGNYAVGISLVSSSNNKLIGNNASNNNYGIYLGGGSNNTLSGNIASNSYYSPEDVNFGTGIKLVSSSNNTLNGNNASNGYSGIILAGGSNNTLSKNKASNNNYGIWLSSSSNNTLNGNIATNNYYYNDYNGGAGIYLSFSSNNTLSGNMMTGNQENFDLDGYTDSDFDNHIDKSNFVDGKPIYYIIKASDSTYDSLSNSGTFYCISCINVTIKDLNLNNNGKGIFFWNTSQSRKQNVNASNNPLGIYLSDSSNNTLIGNNVSKNVIGIYLFYSSSNALTGNNASNNWNGIYLYNSSNNTLSRNNASNNYNGISLSSSSKNNAIYNNIFNNNKNVEFHKLNINTWNATKQSSTNIIGGSFLSGNFWGNPKGTGFSQTCPDANGDGICDKSYTIDAKNIDYLPLAKDKIPPKSVRKLKNITYAKNYINWTWKDPKNIDFKKVMVFIDNNFKKNVSKGKMYYNATNLTTNTRHTISTRTVDMNGNINKTWKNSSAWTAK